MEAPESSMAGISRSFIFTAPRKNSDVELTVKCSRFIGSVRIALSADEAAEIIKRFPALYPKANHHCWAYRVGVESPIEHCSDAGEPAGTAGRPILGMLKRHSLDNTLIVVTRYFGGIKLGVRGLIDAYGEAAELAITEAGVVDMELHNLLDLTCGYDYSKTLLSALHKLGFSEDRQIVNYGENVDVKLEVPCSMRNEITVILEEMAARGFLKKMQWHNEPLIRERWLQG